MVKYVAKRICYIIFVFFLMSIIMFGIFKLVPGDPATMALKGQAKSLSPERYQILYQKTRVRLGLDKPLPVQYVKWFGKMLKGDWGYSEIYRKNVTTVIKDPMKNSILINIFSVLLTILIAIPIGIVSAVKKNSKFDNVTQVTTMLGYSLPTFIIGLVMIFIFCVQFTIFPVSGMNTPGFEGTFFQRFLDILYHVSLPVIVMTVGGLGQMIRYVRASMIEALGMDYIRTARAKGLTEKVVIYSHAFRNALIPILTVVIGWFVSVFAGSIVIEQLFSIDGTGKLLISSLQAQDYNVVMALNMFYFLVALVGNLITDLSYCLVDPRVKLN
ncbi:oligopeptide transport system permease protein OppB [Lachnospiraceae bacterium KM106-2]|nr:oligopeptide transport system permease protein OppB [Lachnospiraceae bacterium KM106-2]